MIVTICDCCKKPIENCGDKVTLSFSPTVTLMNQNEYHLHRACAIRVKNILIDFFARQGTEVKEDGVGVES